MSDSTASISADGAERFSGFVYSCRRARDGSFTFDAAESDTQRILELSPVQVNERLNSPGLSRDFLECIDASARDSSPWFRDMSMTTPRGGRQVWLRGYGAPKRQEDDSVVWSGIIMDVTDLMLDRQRLRQALDEVARNETWMRAALIGARMLGWELDLEHKRWLTTVDVPDFYGLPRGPDYTDPEIAMMAVHPDDVSLVRAARQRAIDEGEPVRYEFRGRIPAADGGFRWFATRGQIVRDSAGKPIRIVAVTTDVTERKRAEQEREALDRRLLETQKWESIGVLAGGVAHDFNNILTVVLGSAGLARKILPVHSPATPFLEQIEQASRRAADLCRQLLAYSGRGQKTAARTDLNQLIRDSAALLGVPAAKTTSISYALAESLPPVSADAAQVRQVLVNLVMNSDEAMEVGGGEIRVETSLNDLSGGEGDYQLPPEAGRYVRLAVSDTGHGISGEIHARIFDPFFTTRIAGRGLGLAAVLGIMRAHHGAIRVRSVPGRGTTVEVFWPTGEIRPAATDGDSDHDYPVGRKALIVDDEMFVREMTASTLVEFGYETLLAGDADTALALFREHRTGIGLAVIDLVLPGKPGHQLLEEIRALSPRLPVVLISGVADRRVIEQCDPCRTEFLQKPFHPEELLTAVKTVGGSPGKSKR
jgi:signal transduction histidine kinase/CheY-like chemotaxis protein